MKSLRTLIVNYESTFHVIWDNFPPFLVFLFLLRLAVPYVNYILFPALTIAAIFSIYKVFSEGKLKFVKKFLIVSSSLLLSIIILAINYLFRSNFHKILTVELLHSLSSFVVLIFLMFSIDSKDKLVSFFKRLGYLIIVFSGIIGLAGITKLFFQFKGIYFDFLDIAGYPNGTSLTIDSNFFSLFMVFGIIFMLKQLASKTSITSSIFNQILLFILTFNVLLSISRRGMLIALLTLGVIITIWILSFIIKKKEWLGILRRNTWGFMIIFIISITFAYYYLFVISPLSRNQLIVNSPFTKSAIEYLTSLILKSQSIYKDSITYIEVRDKLWKGEFDPRYPYSGWGVGNYIPVEEIKGKNSEIVPEGSIGYKLDKNSNWSTWNGNAYSYTKVFSGKLLPGKRYISSVYCYVSKDFNGDWVRISSQGKRRGLTESYYDLSKKEEWQKLQLSIEGDSADYNTYLYFAKNNTISFDSLTGYVIFAYPHLDSLTFDPKLPITWADGFFEEVSPLFGKNVEIVPKGSMGYLIDKRVTPSKSRTGAYTSTTVFRYNTNPSVRYVSSVYCYVSNDFNGSNVRISTSGDITGNRSANYDLSKRGEWQILSVNSIGESGKAMTNLFFNFPNNENLDTLKGYVIFAYPKFDSTIFRSKYPITWANGNFKEEFILKGNNNDIVPSGSIGCYLDNKTNYYVNAEGAYYSSVLFNYNTIKNKRYISTIYAYVSNDFNGENLRIVSTGNIDGERISSYDLSRKGEWQQLRCNSIGKGGYANTNIVFNLPQSNDFKGLKGNVIFASPQLRVTKFDPLNPDTYAKDQYYQKVEISGKGLEIVPKGSFGYRINNKTSGRTWENIYYSRHSFNVVETIEGDSLMASVYIYASEDFNGNTIRIELTGDVDSIARTNYNLKNKGKWQKIQVKVKAKKGSVTSSVLFYQRNVNSFRSLKGYIDIAFPVLLIKRKGVWIESNNIVLSSINNRNINFQKAGILSINLESNSNLNDKDSVDLVKEKFVTSNNEFSGPRLDRWRFAMYLYINKYSDFKKIFGGGFDHTSIFAVIFNMDEGYDYPHNPFLSVLLYSGIVGVLAYLWLLYKVISLYWLYRKDYWPWFLCFLTSFFYSFFSANSPFDPAVMALFMVLPFAIHFIHSKDKNETTKD